MLQVPGAVQTLHTHSIAAHGHSTGAYNTCNYTVAGPAFMLQFGITYWLWLINRHSLETLSKANQVLLAHFDFETCIERLQTYTGFGSWLLGACCRPGESIG